MFFFFLHNYIQIFDENNILNLDYQGLDEKETYQKDAQDIQNQRAYYSQKRSIIRKRIRKEIENEIQIQKRQEKYALPKYFDLNFDVNDNENLTNQKVERNNTERTESENTTFSNDHNNDLVLKRPVPNPIPLESSADDEVLACLIRTHQKSHNVEKLEKEFEHWKTNITQIKLNMMKKEEEKLTAEKHLEKIKNENLVFDLAEEDFKNFFTNDLEKIWISFNNLPSVYQKKEYPKNLDDVIKMRKEYFENMKTSNKEQEFIKSNLSDLENGVMTFNRFKGFDSKDNNIDKNNNIENNLPVDCKNNNTATKVELTCMTREEWLANLMPLKKSYNESHLQKKLVHINNCSPNDENYILFKPESYNKNKKITESPVKSEISKSKIKIVTDSINRNIPIIKNPKCIHIKKFNLSGYLFGTNRKNQNFNKIATSEKAEDNDNKQNLSKNIALTKKRFEENQKQIKRMEALGISTEHNDISTNDSDNTQSETDDSTTSDWIPSQESLDKLGDNPKERPQTNIYARHKKHRNLLFLENKLKENTSTDTIRYPFNKPIIGSVQSDTIFSPNLQTEKTDFAQMFNIRHHHHHRDNAQHKTVLVKYLPKIPKNPNVVKKQINKK